MCIRDRFKLDLSFLGWYLLEWGLAILAQVIFLIPTLIGIFQSGATPETLMTLVAGTTAGSLVGLLLCLPVELWLLPYTGLARAGFYDARISFVPPAPPLYTCLLYTSGGGGQKDPHRLRPAAGPG